ncbi:hypothetical protein SAMN05192568_107011 [Methylobacterium pseudosasicola]|uniref:O-Antigen ligase n=2 Tax=Methylobacterium pseudosasicola TaxID=582667 RepID=A0A1I4UH90_9HYPH|nr:hypothetical protein SAMN05192568_107011 [Methylobacterium pseudosasicola]
MYVYPVRSAGIDYVLVPLSFTTSNLTQEFYLILSYSVALVVSLLSSDADFQSLFRSAILSVAIAMILTGAIDYLGAGWILEFTRNASYALAGETNIGSSRRVVGAMPEASSFGWLMTALLSILILLRKTLGLDSKVLICIILAIIFVILCASSTAYGMFVALIFAFLFQTLLRAVFDGQIEREKSILEIICLSLLCVLLFEIVLYVDAIRAPLFQLVDELVLNKSASSSFEERTRWSRIAYEAFISSYGLGIGVGSARTSNGLINILASTGVIGSVLFLLYILRLFYYAPANHRMYDRFALSLSMLSPFIGLALSSATADFGIILAILFGLQSPKSLIFTGDPSYE